MKRVHSLLLVVGVLLVSVARVSAAQVPCPGNFAERARVDVATANGISTAQTVLTEQSRTMFPETGAPQACNYKVVDLVHRTTSERNYTVGGVVVDLDKAWLKEKLAYRKKYGRLNPALWHQIQRISPEQVIKVGFFLEVPQVKRPSLSPEAPLEEVLLVENALESGYQSTTAEVTARFAEAVASGSPSGAATTFLGAPFVLTDLRASEVSLWSNYTGVLEVYWIPDSSQPRWVQLHNVHQQSTGIDIVHQTLKGTGQGVTLYEFGNISTENGHVPSVRKLPSAILENDPTTIQHATSVVGVLRTDETTCAPGYLPEGSIFLTGQPSYVEDFSYPNLLTEAISFGSRVHSFSQGYSPDRRSLPGGIVPVPDGKIYELGRLLDDASLNRQITAVAGVGNSRNEVDPTTNLRASWEGRVFDPATAYQVIAAGGTMTLSTPNLADDVIYSLPSSHEGSSYVNPSSQTDDREKPELVAPALVPSINNNGIPFPQFSIFAGTSMAAPAIASGAALLIQKRALLRVWPEAIRASLIAGAFHNIEGREQRSEHDGAGAVRFDRSVAAANTAIVEALPGDCASIPKPVAYATQKSFTGNGRRARIALAFNSATSYIDYTLQSSADLDLLVWRILPNGNEQLVGASQTWAGTFESVDFIPAPGTFFYRIEVVRWRCEASPRYFSLAFAEE